MKTGQNGTTSRGTNPPALPLSIQAIRVMEAIAMAKEYEARLLLLAPTQREYDKAVAEWNARYIAEFGGGEAA